MSARGRRHGTTPDAIPDRAVFEAYRGRYKRAIQAVLATAERGRYDEAAFPAYANPNPIINWLFWRRLRLVMNHVGDGPTIRRALDFGCGSGVMLPFLAARAEEVIAADVDLLPLQSVAAHLPLPENVRPVDLSQVDLGDEYARGCDVVLALDVLEHVPNLGATVDVLLSLLSPGGQLIVSAPTENVFYKLGRKVAGPEYSGDYHERGASDIRRELERKAVVTRFAALCWPVVLFELLTASCEKATASRTPPGAG